MIFIFTLLGLSAVWVSAWRKFRDPFHPLIYLMPLFMFLYGWMPLQRSWDNEENFDTFVGGSFVYVYQGITVLLILSLVLGVRYGARASVGRYDTWARIDIRRPTLVRSLALMFGFISVGSFIYLINTGGGFEVAYGTAYGGGQSESGYVYEIPYIGLLGAAFVYAAKGTSKLKLIDILLLLICLSPTLIHALLGARRGPAFLGIVSLFGGYIYFARIRVSPILVLAGGVSIGLLMLFLVSNRDKIYLGSTLSNLSSPTQILDTWQANEYLIGSAAVRVAETQGAFYGLREIIWIIARFTPKSLWPTVYTDLPKILGTSVNLWVNGGVDPQSVFIAAGWTPSPGSAEGFVGSLWLEFQYLSPAFSWLIGYLYGRMWLSGKSRIDARVVYILMVGLSIYLVTQSLDPWLYRLLLLGLPGRFLVRKFQSVRFGNPDSTGRHLSSAARILDTPNHKSRLQ